MKQLQFFILSFVLLFSSTACNKNKPVTNRNHYKQYLQSTNNKLTQIDKEIAFWSKRLQEDTAHFGAQSILGGLYAKRFQYSGNIKEVYIADSFYKCANRIQKYFSSGIYKNLAANAITKHQFWQSKYFLDTAAQMGDNYANTILQQFDTELELGNTNEAERLLKRYPSGNSFEVLIRKAKLSDHKGHLDEAIELMEQALGKVTAENDKAVWLWVTSNLGDFYAHANRFADAYKSYLDVLRVDAENYHCLKGIAWLAFSYERNTTAAKEILHFLKQQHPVPDYDLLLAEIAAYENNQPLNHIYIKRFVTQTQNSFYGDMYNKYLFNLYADELNETKHAMQIAQTEIRNRPTPESYNLLSWAYFKSGNLKEALRIAKSYVEGKCFEPDVAYHLAIMYKANGDEQKAKKYMKEVKHSLFELGPSFEKLINAKS